jgi:hypothetical protein
MTLLSLAQEPSISRNHIFRPQRDHLLDQSGHHHRINAFKLHFTTAFRCGKKRLISFAF